MTSCLVVRVCRTPLNYIVQARTLLTQHPAWFRATHAVIVLASILIAVNVSLSIHNKGFRCAYVNMLASVYTPDLGVEYMNPSRCRII